MNKLKPAKFALLWLSCVVIAACSSSNGRYKMAQDTAPTRLPTPSELRDPIPRPEPLSRQGNASYELFGQTYHIMGDVKDYQAEGMASWYGRKFHGHLTSNGEYYDMFSMSAAHKTLPLPTYLRVTNLANDKSVIVRVNDRGPFHGDRIIDLSYSAAYKIGMLETGTARVRVEAVQAPMVLTAAAESAAPESKPEPEPQPESATTAVMIPPVSPSTAAEPATEYFVQVMSSSNQQRLQQEADALSQLFQFPATTHENNGLYRLVVGPFPTQRTTEVLQQLRENGYPDVFRVLQP